MYCIGWLVIFCAHYLGTDWKSNSMNPGELTAIQKKRLAIDVDPETMATILGLGPAGAARVRQWENGQEIPAHIARRLKNIPKQLPYKASETGHTFKFIDLFAGVGGIRIPFQEKGGKCVFTAEWDKHSQTTYAANFGEVPEKGGDITAFSAKEIPSHNLLLAGFPCQAFSQAGRKEGFLDTRGTMFFEVQRILAYHQPEAFLLENVKQLQGHDKGRTLATIMATLRGNAHPDIPEDVPMSDEARDSLRTRLNYDVDFRVLRARDFGVPQNRERIFIVGLKRKPGQTLPDHNRLRTIFDRVEEKHKVKMLLKDALQPDDDYTRSFEISDRLWKGHVERKARNKANGKGFGYSLFTRESEYCNTISARYYKDGSEILIDQSHLGLNPRKLTPEEARAIQGFDDKFWIGCVSPAQAYRQFGNSVAVPVIRAIATELVPELSAILEA